MARTSNGAKVIASPLWPAPRTSNEASTPPDRANRLTPSLS